MTAKLASSCSLLLVLALGAFASTYREFSKALEGVTNLEDLSAVSGRFDALADSDFVLFELIDEASGPADIAKIKLLVEMRAASVQTGAPDASRQAKEIKSSPLYRDPGVQDQSNWLDGAIKRLIDLIPKNAPKSNVSIAATAIPGWIVPGMWVLLGVGVGVFGYLVLRHFNWKKGLKRKTKAVLEDDEPERTLDEWLVLADDHLANGRYREAVRAMYLSCLLKFDEAGVARFTRGETNWEHLRRISASIKRPLALDFMPPTRAFDRIWYGHHVNGREDVEQFRGWYQEISESLRGVGK